MSTPAEDLAAAMKVQGRDYAWVAFWLGLVTGLLIAFIAVNAGIAIGDRL